jgi:hypothetical protein
LGIYYNLRRKQGRAWATSKKIANLREEGFDYDYFGGEDF